MKVKSPKTIIADVLALILCIALAGWASVLLRQDVNYDLQNYHFYIPWAFVNGRIGWDIAPAQIQTYLNPLADLPFYFMIMADWPPQLIAFALAIPAGIAAWLFGKLLMLLFVDVPGPQRLLCVFGAWAIGLTGSNGVGILGTTMNDWVGVPMVIGALWILVRVISAKETDGGALIAGGILVGLATGLKLSNATMAVGIAAALLVLPRKFGRRFLENSIFSVGVVAGIALAGGYWMAVLWTRFDSPVFPFFNNWIKSPWWIDHPGVFRGFGPHTVAEWFTFPFRYMQTEAGFFGEMFFRDWRFPIAYVLALAMACQWIWKRRHLRSNSGPSDLTSGSAESWKFLTIFWLVTFLLWAAQHSIQRYIVALEILTGALIIGAVRALVPTRYLPFSVVAITVAAIVPTVSPNFGRIDFRSHWFEVQIPPVASRALVLMLSSAPMSFVLPYFPSDARFVGIDNTFNDSRFGRLLLKTKTYEQMQQVVKSHDGPIYSLNNPNGPGYEAIVPYRLRQLKSSCQDIQTNMGTTTLQLCKLERVPAD